MNGQMLREEMTEGRIPGVSSWSTCFTPSPANLPTRVAARPSLSCSAHRCTIFAFKWRHNHTRRLDSQGVIYWGQVVLVDAVGCLHRAGPIRANELRANPPSQPFYAIASATCVETIWSAVDRSSLPGLLCVCYGRTLMRSHCVAVAFVLGLFASKEVWAQGAALQSSRNAEFTALLGAPLPPAPSAEFPPSHLRPYSVGQLNAQPSSYSPGVPMPAPKNVTRWYGWKTIIGVASSDVLAVAGALTALGSSVGGAILFVGLSGHVLTGPIVHWSHGHVWKGFSSLSLNLGLPLLGGLVGSGIDASNGSSGYAFAMATVGYFVAPFIDIAAFSTEEVEKSQQKGSRLLLPSSVAIVPMIDGNRRGLSIVGQF